MIFEIHLVQNKWRKFKIWYYAQYHRVQTYRKCGAGGLARVGLPDFWLLSYTIASDFEQISEHKCCADGRNTWCLHEVLMPGIVNTDISTFLIAFIVITPVPPSCSTDCVATFLVMSQIFMSPRWQFVQLRWLKVWTLTPQVRNRFMTVRFICKSSLGSLGAWWHCRCSRWAPRNHGIGATQEVNSPRLTLAMMHERQGLIAVTIYPL